MTITCSRLRPHDDYTYTRIRAAYGCLCSAGVGWTAVRCVGVRRPARHGDPKEMIRRAFFVSAGLTCQDEEHDSMSEKGRSWVGRLYSGACTVCRETSRLAGEQVKIQASRQDFGRPKTSKTSGEGITGR